MGRSPSVVTPPQKLHNCQLIAADAGGGLAGRDQYIQGHGHLLFLVLIRLLFLAIALLALSVAPLFGLDFVAGHLSGGCRASGGRAKGCSHPPGNINNTEASCSCCAGDPLQAGLCNGTVWNTSKQNKQ